MGSRWWAPGAIGWWIGILFAIGAVFFAVGSFPPYVNKMGVFHDNITFFTGSIFFTSAAFLQYIEAANAPVKLGEVNKTIKYKFFEPKRIDWWSVSVLSVGTVFFNISTFAALIVTVAFKQIDLYVWSPEVYGSICFLISSYLAWLEVGHSIFSWKPRSISWWIALLNIAGSVAFGVSAVAAFTLPKTGHPLNLFLMNIGTFVGAVCFFAGALLLLPERFKTNNHLS